MDLPRVLLVNTSQTEEFANLKGGDILCGRIPLRKNEHHILLDLVDRGIHLIPSATAQLASRSKTFQARIFSRYMLPNTIAIYDRHQLLETTNLYNKENVIDVVLKQERKNAGIGVIRFNSIEAVYAQAAMENLQYPFIIQPYVPGTRDIRVIVLGEYIEAYARHNPHNFRNNLHCGGETEPFTVTEEMKQLCYSIMQRGNFPYAFLDFMISREGEIFLSEINLRGGMRGASLSSDDFKQKAQAIEKGLVEKMRSGDEPLGC